MGQHRGRSPGPEGESEPRGSAVPNATEPTRLKLEGEVAGLRARVADLESKVGEYRAEHERLQHSEHMLRIVMDTIPQRIFWKDREYHILGCNRPYWQDGGYSSEEEVVGKSDFELSWRESAHIYRADDVAVIEQGRTKINYEEPYVRTDGQRLWLRTTKVPLRAEDGRVIGLFGCYEDITERHEALRALRESEARYRALFEHAQDGIFVADKHGFFARVNSAGQAMLGYSEEELRKKRIPDIIDPLDLEKTPFRANAVQVGKRFITQRNLLRKDGASVPTEISATVLPDGSFEAIVREIGDRLRAEEAHKKLQEELLHAQKMDSIGRLAGGIAHDFNNLLLVILANAHLLRHKVPDRSQELEGIIAAGERASTLTRQLLSFSCRRVLKPTVLDFNEVLRGLQQVLGRLLGEKVKLEVLLCDAPCPVLADAGQVEQVILNLAVNARDAMTDGGLLTIRTDLARGAHGTMDVVVVRISDTGHGMEAETQRRVFEPFFTRKPVGEGTGLGLAMVYGVITQSGGTITVSSAPDQGTTFEIRLPVASVSADEPVQVPVVMPGVRSGDATILLAEDDQSVRGTVERALLDAGYRVLVASDGDEALRLGLAHLQDLDLLLTDVVMPTLSGPLLTERLLAERRDLQVILMSGYSEQLFGTDGVWDARASFIEKPFTPNELLRRIAQALGRGQNACS